MMEKLSNGATFSHAYTKAFSTWESRALRTRRLSKSRTLRSDEVLVPFKDMDYILVYEKDYEIEVSEGFCGVNNTLMP